MPPDEWIVSRICEEFGCTPGEAMSQPIALVLDIMDLRAYARAKDLIDRAEKQSDVPEGPMTDLVWEIQRDYAIEARHGRKKSSPSS